MPRIVIWDEKKAKQELKKRLDTAIKYRTRWDKIWENNEQLVYNTRGFNQMPNARFSFTNDFEFGVSDIDEGEGEVGINYTFKHVRFIHAQLSANPPSVLARPTSSDPTDRSKADAADRLNRHALRAYKMQENIDLVSLDTVVYGTGFMKTVWDTNLGDIVEFDEESGEVQLEGDISCIPVSPKRMYLDPDAKRWDEVRYTFEEIIMPLEEAIFRWPDKEKILIKAQETSNDAYGVNPQDQGRTSDIVKLYEYYEKGMPLNGMLGRHGICTRQGDVIDPITTSDHKFATPASEGQMPMPPTAVLPYHIFTDIDVPEHVFGKSFVEYESTIQDTINRLDSVTLDNLQAHGLARMVLPESAEIMDDALSNSPWDVVKITGTQPPHFMEVPQLPPFMDGFRDRLQQGGNDVAGVNDAMFGDMKRETSGFTMQYATNNGNMIRRRLFNKYAIFVESVYKSYLELVRKHWTEARTVSVLGKNKAFEAVDIKGADISGGFDLVVEYGASLSLDPMTRREEIMTLMPLFEKAGVDTQTLLGMVKLNELDNMYGQMQLAEDRQKEVIDLMIASEKYIAPDEIEDHAGMLFYLEKYVMTAEYKSLDPAAQELIRTHLIERRQMRDAGVGLPGMPAAPGPDPQAAGGAMPPMPGMAPGAAPGPLVPG